MVYHFYFFQQLLLHHLKKHDPRSGVSRKLIQRRNVLFPEPELPSMDITSPFFALRDNPRSTCKLPKLLWIFSATKVYLLLFTVFP